VKPADRAWLTLFMEVTVYEVTAARRGWELLSEAMDRSRGEGEGRVRDDYSEIARLLIDGAIVYLALHLRRRWPRRLDPLTWLGAGIRRWSAR
jgi:hypothetical protein